MFNAIVPRELGFINKDMKKKALGELIFQSYRRAGLSTTVQLLDRLKEFGFRNATRSGFTVGIDDFVIPLTRDVVIGQAVTAVNEVRKTRESGVLDDACKARIVGIWGRASRIMNQCVMETLASKKDIVNPMFAMVDSGAKPASNRLNRISGMCGLIARPVRKSRGDSAAIVETPVLGNYRMGLGTAEYFVSAHGARKGLTDAALKTGDAGYLTRRLVDVAQDVTITEEDCGAVTGLEVGSLKEGEDVIEPLSERIVGTVAAEDILDPQERDSSNHPTLLVEAGQLISEEVAQAIEESGLETVTIRSVLTCEARHGLCQMCYGRNPATMSMVDKGEAVGIIAAQSIGEPGTQLTLRTFHTGGEATPDAPDGVAIARYSGIVAYSSSLNIVQNTDGARIACNNGGELCVYSLDRNGDTLERVVVPEGAAVRVADGDCVDVEDVLCTWNAYVNPIVTEFAGTVKTVDLLEGENVREINDRNAPQPRRFVKSMGKKSKLDPRIEVWTRTTWREVRLASYRIPAHSELVVQDGEMVNPGQTVARLPGVRTRLVDITRRVRDVERMFEARIPKSSAVLAEFDGEIRVGRTDGGVREIFLTPGAGDGHIYQVDDSEGPAVYEVPIGTRLLVGTGDRVHAGDRLSEGPVNPHDILRIKGLRAVHGHLLRDIQRVYRLHGVRINDKHIGVIVRQMLQKERIMDSGDTEYLEGEHVDRMLLRENNALTEEKGKRPATSEPLLLGITKASLTTQSFISAASFQQTTRVLTDAAIRGAKDDLMGLKENVIIGHLIPAGTGVYRYQEVDIEGVSVPAPVLEEPPEPTMEELLAAGDEDEDFRPKAGAAAGAEAPGIKLLPDD
jgi:DNA-directed RNA polymerase subunit beta'